MIRHGAQLGDANAERKGNLVVREGEGQEANLTEQAADSLSSAFESFEGVLSSAFESLSSSAEEPTPNTAKKVA